MFMLFSNVLHLQALPIQTKTSSCSVFPHILDMDPGFEKHVQEMPCCPPSTLALALEGKRLSWW